MTVPRWKLHKFPLTDASGTGPYEGPVPEVVFINPQDTEAFKFIAGRFAGRAPTVRRELQDRAHNVVAHALEKAIASGACVDGPVPLDGLVAMRDSGKAAHEALLKVLRALRTQDAIDDPRPVKTKTPKPKYSAHALAMTRVARKGEREHSQMKLPRARRDVAILIAAKSIAFKLADDSERRRKSFADVRKNEGEPVKRAFVPYLMEAWIFLMGQRPGTSPLAEQNPFLLFVEAAWRDWWGSEVDSGSFVSAMRAAAAAISDYDAEMLAANRPDWLM